MKKNIKKILKKILPNRIFVFLQRMNLASHAFVKAFVSFKEFNMPALVLSVGQACNFKCRDCGNFSPFSPKEYMRYELDDIKKDIDKILAVIKKLDYLQIQGGEPFLYSDLIPLLSYLNSTRKIMGGGELYLCSNKW